MTEELTIYFFKGKEEILNKPAKDSNRNDPLQKLRDSFTKVLDGKNLSFLLGCGCSSFVVEKIDENSNKIYEEIGIPTMAPLAKCFYSEKLELDTKRWLKEKLNLDIDSAKYSSNLESLLGTLHSLYYFYENTSSTTNEDAIKVKNLIKIIRNYILDRCLNENNSISGNDLELIELYKAFYRKLLYRNANLQKPNIFTTNYDLYSEVALDKLGIHYANGFSGGINKYFNPTIFNYALAEKMDLSQTKWSVIDNFFYLYKIHGSLNWVQDNKDLKLFKVREIQETTYERLEKEEIIMIHPTPLKNNASLGSPYSDLFREFQNKLMQNNNILITIGYSFNDEHINNLIYQAFTIPSFRLIVLGDPNSSKEIKKLQALDDPRIWTIWGDLPNNQKLHYFKGFVETVMPDLSNDQIDNTIEETLKRLLTKDE